MDILDVVKKIDISIDLQYSPKEMFEKSKEFLNFEESIKDDGYLTKVSVHA